METNIRDEFKEFLIKLFTKMATGDFTVKVECANDKMFEADVIGYSEEYMNIHVRFHSDDLTKPGVERVPTHGWGYGGPDEDEDYDLVPTQIPVKEEQVFFQSIKIS